MLEKVRPPYNLSARSIRRAAEFVLREHGRVVRARARPRSSTSARGSRPALAALRGCEVFASEANLVLVRFGAGRAAAIWQGLADRGIVVRNFDRPGGAPGDGPLAGCLRITVGTADENSLLLAALAELV